MTATFLIVRHGEHDHLGKVLTGRMPGVHLAPHGREQAQQLAQHLARLEPHAVHASPRERAQETAAPIAAALGLSVQTVGALDEIDFGSWMARSFDDLQNDPFWAIWNAERSLARAPGGESMREVQTRVVAHLERTAAVHPGEHIVVVSHGDVIKAALLHVVGASLDAIETIEVAPASISTIVLGDWGGKIIGLNERVVP